jgi:hypothetical protein
MSIYKALIVALQRNRLHTSTYFSSLLKLLCSNCTHISQFIVLEKKDILNSNLNIYKVIKCIKSGYELSKKIFKIVMRMSVLFEEQNWTQMLPCYILRFLLAALCQ